MASSVQMHPQAKMDINLCFVVKIPTAHKINNTADK